MKKSDPAIIVQGQYNCTPLQLWNAITNLNEMKLWYFENIPSFEAKEGFKTKFIVKSASRTFTHNWEITSVVDGQLIQYDWTFDEYPGKSFSRFEVKESSLGCNLILTCEVIRDFDEEIPEFKRESCIGGWEYFLNQRLKSYLEKLQ